MNFIQYVKQVWKARPIGGTPFTPDRFNHIEDGIKNNNDMISELNNNINELLISYYKSEPTLTLKKGTYWIFINKTQYSQSSIWAISSGQQPVAVANPSNEQMSIELNNDIMTITWKNASYAVVSVLKVR
jgi:frataxin-like iron-binding protein CyaY